MSNRIAAVGDAGERVVIWLDDGRGLALSRVAADAILATPGVRLGGWVEADPLPPAPGGTVPRVRLVPVDRVYPYTPHPLEN